MVPNTHRHSYVITQPTNYQVIDSSARGSQASKGKLEVGRVVWLEKDLEEWDGETCVPAYADGIGHISVDRKLVRKAH